MPGERSYNPLDKRNLGVSVADALLQSPVGQMPPAERFVGAGIYAIYYVGNFRSYRPISAANSRGKFNWPIYVGKAIPAGGRTGGKGFEQYRGFALFNRLNKHATSISQAGNIDIADFFCRYLVVDDIWIPLGESLLIEKFAPLWNRALDGFGNNDPGKGRYQQERSPWDVIHPGRDWAERCVKNRRPERDIVNRVKAFLKDHSREA